ncbi:MAG: hypothetical protein V4517_26340 [Pseudomonadota bacterium]
MLLAIVIDWPAFALLMTPPLGPARLKLMSAPLITYACEFELNVQESGAMGPPDSGKLVAPVVAKIADWPATTGGAPAGGFPQLVCR